MEIIITWITQNWFSIVAPSITGVVAYFGARKKNKLDLTSQSLDNVAQEFQIYKTVLKDTTEGFRQVIESRNEELKLLKAQNQDLKNLVNLLNIKVDKLTKEVRKFEREYTDKNSHE